MIDLGFEPQINAVLDAMPSSNMKPANEEEELEASKVYRTTYMFSATMPPLVERLARKYLRSPVVVTIGSAGKAAALITQRVVMCKEADKTSLLEREVANCGDTQTIVFTSSVRMCDVLVKTLARLGKPAAALHSGKLQDVREASI